ncbi:hypothetical protein HNR00_003560 [Methylorubrum rhodinum]|uniref:Uncharacterized protein n=1 Tax=Methylorubrum rhodinum TaxID=29428 RepID=A0A840ZQ48_9HYPH|nr:hypothetical protein [Methylorubrum rhodinum]MBB5758833.1 hypothetical protein [Methylorubrum rhodinum]
MRAGPRPKLVGDAEHLDPGLVLPSVQAAAPRQADCDICGLVEAGCFGFGVFRNRRGVWACDDIDCCAEAKARAAESHRQLVAAE